MEILVTGGASGLGLAITNKLVTTLADAKIYVTYSASKTTAVALSQKYSNVEAIKVDFKKEDDVESLCNFLKQKNVDVIVNNALSGLNKNYFHKTEPLIFTESFKNNVLPVLKITQAFILNARKRKSGKIITVLSSAILNNPPLGMSVYLAEKNYLLAVHKSWAVENAAFNITSNCVSPGFMNTKLNEQTDSRIIDDLVLSHPLKKLLTINEVADSVIFLINASNQLNMQNIVINSSLL